MYYQDNVKNKKLGKSICASVLEMFRNYYFFVKLIT